MSVKNWIWIKVLQLTVWVGSNLLGANITINQNIAGNMQEPEYQQPCEMCRDHVMIAGIQMHVSQLRAIEDEWVERGLIR